MKTLNLTILFILLIFHLSSQDNMEVLLHPTDPLNEKNPKYYVNANKAFIASIQDQPEQHLSLILPLKSRMDKKEE